MAARLIGQNFVPPDVLPKVTGRAKFVEDFRVEGMLHCRLLTSRLPHARVKSIDTAAARKMSGVVAILTADDVPAEPPGVRPLLTNEPTYVGAPILAVAAVDEATAAQAVEAIVVDLAPLPFTLDPLLSLSPGGANARSDGNVGGPEVDLQTVKWDAAVIAEADGKRIPDGKPTETWQYGDLEAGFHEAKLILEEPFVTASVPHQTLETHAALAYWQNGKCFIHGSSQSQTLVIPVLAKQLGIDPANVVFIGEYCGGGFGSKGQVYPTMVLPALVARKTGRPVMLHLSRAEEYFLGSARHGFQGSIRIGFAADGRITALDVYLVQDQGGVFGFQDYRSAGVGLSVIYQPEAMRWRGIPVLTNTPPCGAMRGPGQNQMVPVIEPLIDKAARQLGIDRLTIRKINAPQDGAHFGARRDTVSSAYVRDILDKGAEKFGWQERLKRSAQRKGSKITGVAVGQGFHPAGSNGFDGLLRITPDGKLHVHTGVSNLGTYSYAATSRIAAEVLNYDWSNVVIERGDTRRGLPWNSVQGGSNTCFTESRTNLAAAQDLKRKLFDIAARDLGGTADDYELGAEKVVSKSDGAKSMSVALAAKRAIALGGAFSGYDLPPDIHPLTKAAALAIAGTGLVGVAKDTLPRPALVASFCATFVEVELDAETGQVAIVDMLAVSDNGIVIHPQGIAAQIRGASVMGIGLAQLERRVYDPRLGLPANVGYIQVKPPSWLDVPAGIETVTLDRPEPLNPFGIKGVGEPPMGSAAAAVVCAISDALGGVVFNRLPVALDMILYALANQPPPHRPLQVHTV
jgi:CO/xanthine dehydrogenase Mo-binding subunit